MSIPFACVFAAFLLIYFPRGFVVRAQMAAPGGLDNRYPRDQQATLTGLGKRAQGAHLNSIETFGPFAASVFVAVLGHGKPRLIDLLSVGFVGARCVYIGLYLGDVPSARTLVWMVGLGCTIGLFLLPLLA